MPAYNKRFCTMAGGKCCVEARVVKRPPLRKAAGPLYASGRERGRQLSVDLTTLEISCFEKISAKADNFTLLSVK